MIGPHFSLKPVTEDSLDYLMDGKILIELYGLQVPMKRERVGNTKQMMQVDAVSRSMVSAANTNEKVIDMNKVKSQATSEVLKKRQEQLEKKVHYLREMVNHGEQHGLKAVPLNYIKGVLDAPSTDVLEKWAVMYSEQKSNGLVGHDGRPSSSRIRPKSSACVLS